MTPGTSSGMAATTGQTHGQRTGRACIGLAAAMALVACAFFPTMKTFAGDRQSLHPSACKPYSQEPPNFGLLRIRPYGIYNGHSSPKYVICPLAIPPGTTNLYVGFQASNTHFGDNDIPIGPRQSCTLTVFEGDNVQYTATNIDYCCVDDSPWTLLSLDVSGSGNAVLTCRIQPRSRMLTITLGP